MKYNLKQEIPLMALVTLPFAYLAYIWNSLPTEVPIHWNIKGEIDGYGSKDQLILLLFLLPVLTYVLFQIIPLIDPKKKVEKMGNKFYHLKFFMVFLMSLLAVFILYFVQSASDYNMKIVYVLLGFMIVGIGNYFPALKPNYFIGIRTPWTLENEAIWKQTHHLGGKLWFLGGLLMTLLVLFLPLETAHLVFMVGIAILVLVPIIFSYMRFRASS